MAIKTQPTEKFWNTLLAKIEEGRVIPVVGPWLLQVTVDGRTERLEQAIARRLARRFDVEVDAVDDEDISLHAIVAQAQRADRLEQTITDYHTEVHNILRGLCALEPPEPLLALARIEGFRLYLSLCFDTLLIHALEKNRDLHNPKKQHIGYAPNLRRTEIDIPAPARQLDEPHVYALFGKSCAAPEFVISEEDLLEWIASLQDTDHQPQHIFDALRSHHLLFLGCTLPDWLLRFFVRLTREGRLSETLARNESETIVDTRLPNQPGLVTFLDHFSPRTHCLQVDPAAFVTELETRWQARRQSSSPTVAADVPPDLHPGGVFLSYASDDAVAATSLHGAMTGRRIDVWFDAKRLGSGDSYEKIIKRNIGLCGVFVPVLSRATLARLAKWRDEHRNDPAHEPYFLKEWKLALARAELFEGSLAIKLVRIDDVGLNDPLLPAGLRALTCQHLPDGITTEQFLDQVKASVRESRKSAKDRA
ncbi:toll/interleukin-1 receptor domain-containing protein [Candidatus Symbiobacter mobilis]|uniref:TIR domain-containing protein n=1 Tax=Candidatus Symbiobacter mobilis CR TaxID=946483 RepID=U5N4Y4_9BURK|nr:toll/interleukin-1 receptor domain-containing protein [Candidatus Symbiobacter mobilis]AGX86382.1 hypothetical protein Cenrod_0255 [Candidatus Symbiobacter mobilis CR]